MGLRPRSIRARGTLLTTAVAAVLLFLTAVLAAWAADAVLQSEARGYADRAATRVAGEVRKGSSGSVITPDPRVPLIQVVDANGKVTASSPAARNMSPLTAKRPSPADPKAEITSCLDRSCYEIEAVRVGPEPDSPVVMAGAPQPDFLSSGRDQLLNGLVLLATVGIIAALSWVAIGRVLKPVEELSDQYAEISTGGQGRRIAQPEGDDEISRLVRTVNQTLDQMEQALERQRQFASDASHELRTPIASLRANLEDALLHPDDTDFQEVARASLRAADRLEMVVGDLLLLARIGSGRESKEDIDLSAMLRSEVESDVKTEIEPGLRVHAVRLQLSRLLANLLDNARRYGGSEVRLTARRHGDEVRVTVTDEGPGIPEKERERIFGRFTRLDTARSRDAGGTGLGLAISREVALAHGGSLGVEDTPRGAKFVLRLPFFSEAQEPTADR